MNGSAVRKGIPGNVEHLLSKIELTLPIKVFLVTAFLALLIVTAGTDVQRVGPLLFYLYGSIPFAYMFTYLATGKRIYELGSTNVGVANTFNTAGMAAGTLTVVGEVSKGLVPIAISYLWFDFSLDVACYLIAGSLLGTNFSIFLRGKGGMGTTMMLWSMLFLSPFSFVAVLLLMFLTLRTVKDTYHAALLNYSLAPIVVLLLDGRAPLVLLVLFASTLYVLKLKRSMDDFQYAGGGGMMGKRKRSVGQ